MKLLLDGSIIGSMALSKYASTPWLRNEVHPLTEQIQPVYNNIVYSEENAVKFNEFYVSCTVQD